MRIVTKQEVIDNVPVMWACQYPKNRILWDGQSTDDTLKKLNDTCPLTEQAVNEVIGNDGWTENKCDECWKDSPAVVIIGDDESACSICKSCLTKALDMMP